MGHDKIKLVAGTNPLHCLRRIGDDDPAAFIAWDDEHCSAAVAVLNANAGGLVVPGWLGHAPWTVTTLKAALMARLLPRPSFLSDPSCPVSASSSTRATASFLFLLLLWFSR